MCQTVHIGHRYRVMPVTLMPVAGAQWPLVLRADLRNGVVDAHRPVPLPSQ
jgi:hypothetical protein